MSNQQKIDRPKETFEDEVEVATVNKSKLVAVLFAVFSFLVLGPLSFVTSSGPAKWKDVLATFVFSVLVAVVLYFLFRKA